MKQRIQYILTEVAVVVIGLLIAFQIDRWYENFRENKIEKKILREIKSSLLFDIEELKSNASGHKNAFHYHDTVMHKLNLKEYDTLTALYIEYIFRDMTFTPKMSNFESLKNIGLNIITSDSLRLKLSELYEFEYSFLVKMEEVYKPGQHFDKYFQAVINNFDKWEYVFNNQGELINLRTRPKDFNRLKSNSELHILMNLTRSQHKFTLMYYELTLKKNQEIIDLIDKELQRN